MNLVLVGTASGYSRWANARVLRELRQAVVARLRPTAPRWTGTLVVVELE